jgi:hypothetical protein
MRKLPERNDKLVARAVAARGASPWHAVSIMVGPSGCAAVRARSLIHYLSKDAPRLPLPDCPAPDSCSCSYKHYKDRRTQMRRRDDVLGFRREKLSTDERRTGSDRRCND